MGRNSPIPQRKHVLFCRTGSNTVPGFRLRKLQQGHRIPLCLQYVVYLLIALTVQNLRAQSQGRLQPVFCCLLPSSQHCWEGALGCLVLRTVFVWHGECRTGNVKGRPWPLGHGTSLTGEPGVEPEGEGPADYEINSKSWIFFDLPNCMYFILMKY